MLLFSLLALGLFLKIDLLKAKRKSHGGKAQLRELTRENHPALISVTFLGQTHLRSQNSA